MTLFGRASSILVLGTDCSLKIASINYGKFGMNISGYPILTFNFQAFDKPAQMAELVDALVSGTSVRKYVKVRVLFWAQRRK